MKRIINILILLCCIASLSSCGNSTEERSRVLKIYNWADYIDEDVLAEFPDWYKQQTGEDLRIIYQVFDINEIMLTKIERGHEDFDVVCPSEYIIERMLRKDLLLPIDRNFGHTPDYIPNVSPYIRRTLHVGHRWHPLQQKVYYRRRGRHMGYPLGLQEPRQNTDEGQLPRCLRYRHHLRPRPGAGRQHRHSRATDERQLPAGHRPGRATPQGDETQHRRLGSRLRQGNDDQEQGVD